jgi:hypothetical protein
LVVHTGHVIGPIVDEHDGVDLASRTVKESDEHDAFVLSRGHHDPVGIADCVWRPKVQNADLPGTDSGRIRTVGVVGHIERFRSVARRQWSSREVESVAREFSLRCISKIVTPRGENHRRYAAILEL